MKKHILFLISLLFVTPVIKAQVLYSEDFDNYTLGNLGTDPTGTASGQGGWFTLCHGNTPASNNYFNITSEANKGNVLTLSSSTTIPTYGTVSARRTDINTLINQRTPGNNVIKFEIDYYTGAQHSGSGYAHHIILGDNAAGNFLVANNILIDYSLHSQYGHLHVRGKDLSGNIKLDKNASPYSNLPFSTWVTLIVYLDYNNKKVYFETPYFNTIAVADFLKNSTSTNLIEDFKPTVLAFLFASQNQTTTVDMVNKYDNIKITALNAVPPYVLNAENFLAQKFNLYPNPATNIVNITNNENMAVQQIMVYDVAGKQLSTQTFNNETEIQLNVENLVSGTYMLHIKTNEGVAVKKVVKK